MIVIKVELDKLEHVERRLSKRKICQAPYFDCKRCRVEDICTKFSQAIVVFQERTWLFVQWEPISQLER